MKKKTKIVLSCLLGVVVLGGIGAVVATHTIENAAGASIQTSDDEYGWRRIEVHIDINSGVHEEKYETNNGDYITNIEFYTDWGYADGLPGNKQVATIEYDEDFSWGDDLEVFFIIGYNGDKIDFTEIKHSDLPIGSSEIDFMVDKRNSDYYIKEIWLRTID